MPTKTTAVPNAVACDVRRLSPLGASIEPTTNQPPTTAVETWRAAVAASALLFLAVAGCSGEVAEQSGSLNPDVMEQAMEWKASLLDSDLPESFKQNLMDAPVYEATSIDDEQLVDKGVVPQFDVSTNCRANDGASVLWVMVGDVNTGAIAGIWPLFDVPGCATKRFRLQGESLGGVVNAMIAGPPPDETIHLDRVVTLSLRGGSAVAVTCKYLQKISGSQGGVFTRCKQS